MKKGLSAEQPAFSIFLFDIDNFKNYNDTNGHVDGDQLLKELANVLKENTNADDLVARYGGEEFIVLFRDIGKEHAMAYAEKIRKRIEAHPFEHREKQPLGCISISGGVAEYPADGRTVEDVIKHADGALYESKESGRNRIALYRAERF